MAPETLPEVPQDEYELVGRLYPESAWTFVWARRILRDFAGEGGARFLVGRLEPGCWSVLRGDGEWLAVRSADEADEATHSHVASFESAQDAVAYAAGGLIIDEHVTIHKGLLQEQGIFDHVWDESARRLVWKLLDEGDRLVAAARDEGRLRYGESCVPLDHVLAHPGGYQVIVRTPGPDGDLFLREHDLFTAHVRSRLPGDFGASTGQELPENTLLDSYASADEPYLFTLDTPFERRGLFRSGRDRVRKFFVVRRPLPVHPGFPVGNTTLPTSRRRQQSGGPSEQGQGYLLPRPIADLLDAGDIARITESETLRIYREQRGQGRRQNG
ncbi:hypothetical protein [Actinomadura sp. BRA 177]|uniref:hypothetical protein n=1 Tax=Actinomadura sp. BRA 177 TaxID=2745202 RepID=UPI0015952DFE|nr:hypothetical protein [Actinomadura sp. BRA 177]NVI91992.1 hypothetical protein [Actinomadura sp. BRA 177]